MALPLGTRLGPYEVTGPIGTGGMGEVYRARDTRLKRDVALTLLPESFAGDPARLARLQREVEILASLNHPNIAAIHGLEESDGTKALVMELVGGDTLADCIARGPMPFLQGSFYFAFPGFGRNYDISLDGQRFLVIKQSGANDASARPSLMIVEHWDQELKRLVPTR